MDTMACALNIAFRTTLLLTGTVNKAEEAVMLGIGACDDLSPRGLVVESARSAVQLREETPDRWYEVESLPPELQRLFLLQPLPRHCFVLRILVGLSAESCAALLCTSPDTFQRALDSVLVGLAACHRREAKENGDYA